MAITLSGVNQHQMTCVIPLSLPQSWLCLDSCWQAVEHRISLPDGVEKTFPQAKDCLPLQSLCFLLEEPFVCSALCLAMGMSVLWTAKGNWARRFLGRRLAQSGVGGSTTKCAYQAGASIAAGRSCAFGNGFLFSRSLRVLLRQNDLLEKHFGELGVKGFQPLVDPDDL